MGLASFDEPAGRPDRQPPRRASIRALPPRRRDRERGTGAERREPAADADALGPGGSTPLLDIDRVGVNWELWNRGGERIVSHPGGTNGQQSGFTLVPERGFAITVMTNATAGAKLWI